MPEQRSDWGSRGDEELASLAQGGSLAAFEHLVSRHEAAVYRYLRRLARDEHAAQDLTQEAFVRAYRNIHRYDPSRRFAAWLFTVARRCAISHLRSVPPEAGAPVPDVAAESAHPADSMALREESEVLWALARRTLSEVQFSALWLRYAEDMEIVEVSGALRRTQLHVKVLLHRARKALERELRREAALGPGRRGVAAIAAELCSSGVAAGREGG
jgi:RNA polymerase sigma-70 factor (ECF subfamily)